MKNTELNNTEKNCNSQKKKGKIRGLLNISPLIIWGGFFAISPKLISMYKEYNYTIETNFDNENDYNENILKNNEETNMNTITIFDEYKKYENNYASNYAVYDASKLTEERLKEVSNKDDFTITDLLGEPLVTGLDIKKEITEEDKYKNVVATIYSESDQYYISRRTKDEMDVQIFSVIFTDIVSLGGALYVTSELSHKSKSNNIDSKDEKVKKLKLENNNS